MPNLQDIINSLALEDEMEQKRVIALLTKTV